MVRTALLATAFLLTACEAPGGVTSTGDLTAPVSTVQADPTGTGTTKESPVVEEMECVAPTGGTVGSLYIQVDDPRTHPIPRIEAWQQVDPDHSTDVFKIPLLSISSNGEATYTPCVTSSPVTVWTYPL